MNPLLDQTLNFLLQDVCIKGDGNSVTWNSITFRTHVLWKDIHCLVECMVLVLHHHILHLTCFNILL